MERGALRRAAGARLVANLSERLRRAVDLEHWAAFNRSFEQLCDWLRTLARGTEAARPPASILLLGGDVHRSSVSEVELGAGSRRRVHQLVCSPFRNPLSPKERRIVAGDRLSRSARGSSGRSRGSPACRRRRRAWRPSGAATFDNSIGELVLDGRAATATLRRSPHEGEDPERLVAIGRSSSRAEPLARTSRGCVSR